MPVDSTGVFVKRSSTQMLGDLIGALRTQFGPNADVSAASPDRKLLEAAMLLPLAESQNDMDDLFRQMFFESATGDNLDKLLEPFGFRRKQAVRATGLVELDYLSIPTTPSPFFPTGSLTFRDSAGNIFTQIAPVEPPVAAFESTESGVASELIDTVSNTSFAQRVVIEAESSYSQSFRVFTDHVSGTPTFNVRVETDNGGEPSGTLASVNMKLDGFLPADGVESEGVFDEGGYLLPGTYWIVFDCTSGSATFDGGAGGDANQAFFENASVWAASTTIENMNVDLVAGGQVLCRATEFGPTGNISPGDISGIEFSSATIETRWNTYVDTFTNKRIFQDGRNTESDRAFRGRVRIATTSRETASVDGLTTALKNVSSVTGVSVLENSTNVGSTINKVYDSDETGTASETVNGTTTRIAQLVTISERRYVQHFNALVNHVSGTPTYDVRIETDAAGSPSGTLVNAVYELRDWLPDDGTLSPGTFVQGKYLDPGTYWLVFNRTAGDATFDGGTGGTADQVKTYNGSWSLSANVENLNTEVIAGIPPHAFRAYISGGSPDNIAQKIWTTKAAGILSDGIQFGTATDIGAAPHTVYFDRPANIGVVIKLTIQRTSDYSGGVDAAKDAIVAYIGGTDTKALVQPGLAVEETAVRNEMRTRIMEDVTGVFDIPDATLLIGKKASFATPGALTASEVVNLTADVGTEFIIEDVSADISISFVDV